MAFPDRIPEDRRCSETTAEGEPCTAWAMKNRSTCYAHDPEERCTAHITGGTTDQHRAGERCRNRRVPGTTVCKYHGGKAPHVQAKIKANEAEQKIREAMAAYATPIQTTPMKALADEVCRAAGRVEWLEQYVREIEASGANSTTEDDTEDDGEHGEANVITQHPLIWGTTRVKEGGEDWGRTIEASPSQWLQIYNDERDRLVRHCAAALRAGVDERMVKLAENQGRMVAVAIRAILNELNLTPQQAALVGEVVPRQLRAISMLPTGP